MDFYSISILRIVASFMYAVSILLFIVRMGLRILARNNWSYDDCVLLLTMAFSTAGYILLFPMTASDVPASSSHKTTELISAKVVFAIDIIALATIAASKSSTILSILRIHGYKITGKARWMVLYGKLLCYCSLLWGIVSIMLISIRENVGQPWSNSKYPSETWSRWIGISASSSSIELGIFLLVVFTLYPLKMKLFQKMKAFCFLDCRILLIPLAVARDVVLCPLGRSHITNAQLIADMLGQLIIHYGVISASINGVAPMLKTHDMVFVDSRSNSLPSSKPLRKSSDTSGDKGEQA